MTRYTYFKMVVFLSKRLSRRGLYLVARVLSLVSYYLDREKREAVIANLRVVLGPETPEKRLRSEAKKVIMEFGKYLAEFFGYRRFGGFFLDRHVSLPGEEHIVRALEAGRGAVVLTAHLANWEIGAAKLARRGYPLTVVAQTHPDPRADGVFRRQRESRGYTTIPVEGAFRACVKALKQNQIVCFASDRDVGEGGVEVDFFGRATLFPQGGARMALAAGAPMMPGIVIRRENDDLDVFIGPPVAVPAEGDRRRKAHEMTQSFARVVEGYVRRHHTQWGVFHEMWPEEDAGARGEVHPPATGG